MDIQDYFEYIIKKHDTLLGYTIETLTDNPPITIYVNKIENIITFKTKLGHYLGLLTPFKLLGSTKNKIIIDKNSENVPHLEITK